MLFFFQQHFSPNYLIQFRGLLKPEDAPRLSVSRKLFRSWNAFEQAAQEAELDPHFLQIFGASQNQTEGRSPDIVVSEAQLRTMGFEQFEPFDRIFMVSYQTPSEGRVFLRAREWNQPPLTRAEERTQQLNSNEFAYRLKFLGLTAADLLWEGRGVRAPAKAKLIEADVDFLLL